MVMPQNEMVGITIVNNAYVTHETTVVSTPKIRYIIISWNLSQSFLIIVLCLSSAVLQNVLVVEVCFAHNVDWTVFGFHINSADVFAQNADRKLDDTA